MGPYLSIVVPAYNEQNNVIPLHAQLKVVLRLLNIDHEIIFVDDGSRDMTFQRLLSLHKEDKNVKIIKFRKNFGQTAALDAGFKFSKGKVVITMDSDLQNDPADIPRLIKKLDEGYDAVSGIRLRRKDTILKKISSNLAYLLRQAIINDKIRDSGCSLKAYRRSCLNSLYLRGELHRFIPALLKMRGFKVAEIPVNHRKREHGRTKYNIERLVNGFVDVLLIKFWQKFSSQPMHFFGMFGLFSFLAGLSIAAYLTLQKMFYKTQLADRPLLLLAVLFIIIGLQSFFFGLLADIMMRIYYKREEPYDIERVVE